MCRRIKRGFTMVETMLAMAFISMLLIGIAVVTSQVIKTYRKGLAMKTVNQVGQSVSNDLSWIGTGGRKVQFNQATDFVSNNDFGVLCVGGYSYIWSTGSAIVAPSADKRKPLYYHDPKNEQIRLIKVRDNSKNYCDQASQPNAHSSLNNHFSRSKVQEIIAPGDARLAINDLKTVLGPVDARSGQSLLTVVFSIGTFYDNRSIDANARCLVDKDSNWDFNCAINKFEVTIRTQ